jgi:cytoskeletal protein CcmA (bactofilin family)
MFTKKPEKEPSAFDLARGVPPLPPSGPMPQAMPTMARAAAKTGMSQIGSDLTVVGNLLSKGEVHIDGEIQGDVHAGNVVVGESARITGGLVADEVIVRGTVMGSIRGKRVVLQSSSKVEGDIFHSQLAIEQGAFFEGKSRRSDDPTAGVQRPDVPVPNGQTPSS